MKVPLAVHRSIDGDEQFLDVWSNGAMRRVRAPFLPYCYSKKRLPGGYAREDRVKVRPLSTLDAEEWFRYEFPNVYGVSDASRNETPREMAENHVPFVERVLIDQPDYFTKFPNGDPLRLLTFDVEQLTTGRGFPTEKEPLISIAWSAEELGRSPGKTEVVLGDGKRDDDILATFGKAVRAFDPDIIIGYNLTGYDLPMVVKRLAQNRQDAGFLTRTGNAPDSRDRLHLDGRIIYDVFDSVKMDQTLYGIKNLKLKTVGQWMGLDVVEEDTTDTRKLVGTERLARYNRSDVDLTRNLAQVYFRNFVELAEFYNAPLNVVFRATSTFHTNILQGRVCRGLGIVSDGRNDQRYGSIYASADGGKGFVGGVVDIYQRGLFRPVWKVDFSSMYPSIMVTLGCGADNTRHLGTEPPGPFQVEVDGDRRVFHIPDQSRDVRHVVEVRGTSPMAEELGKLLARRLELKKAAKDTDDPEEEARLHARQNVIKVILNSVYGVMASRHARYGALPVAIATVGVARRLIRVVEDHLGDAKIETDTDGVYSAEPVDVDAVNATVAEYAEKHLSGHSTLRLEVDPFEAGYFHEAKNYLLRHHDGRLEKHGVAFKGSSHCGVFDKTLERVSQALLSGEDDPVEVGRACLDLDAYDAEDFAMRIRLGKDPSDYASENYIGAQIARAAERHLGFKPTKGTQLEYVKTTYGYDVFRDEAMRRIDTDYYKDMVTTLLDRLSIQWQPTQQASLEEWF